MEQTIKRATRSVTEEPTHSLPATITIPADQRWSPTTRSFVFGFALVGLAIFLYWARPLLPPVVIAVAAAYALNPLVLLLERRLRFRHGLAVATIYTLAMALIIATPGTLIPLVVRQTQAAVGDITRFVAQVEAFLSRPMFVFGYVLQPGDMVADVLSTTVDAFSLQAGNMLSFLETTSISFAWLLIILVLTYYFLLDSAKLRDWFVNLAPPDSRSDLSRLITEIGTIWQSYVGGILALIVITALVMTLVWSAVGLQGAIPVGILTGVLVVIPELGTLLAGLLAVGIAYFLGPLFLPLTNTAFAILVGVLHILLTQLRARWLQPLLHDGRLRLHPGVVFVAIMGALVVQGVLAALAVVPVLATVRAIGHYARCRLFGLDPWEGYLGLS